MQSVRRLFKWPSILTVIPHILITVRHIAAVAVGCNSWALMCRRVHFVNFSFLVSLGFVIISRSMSAIRKGTVRTSIQFPVLKRDSLDSKLKFKWMGQSSREIPSPSTPPVLLKPPLRYGTVNLRYRTLEPRNRLVVYWRNLRQ
ncbi:hypothetical protein L873DRAFT_1035020 [Choiromyces venosus 120613-1]|uniref:Uncharacterized protein n=1 Tax=Choiromyces venosus 120613-1 TaxID=1336337 RepID=A0A3N4JJW7_9PEZI|nr:hypothetical protein L873DRAFT_1035020 [Choiromyces venosus 120613-1]